MDDDAITDEERHFNQQLLFKECGHLMTEIERLQLHKQTLDDRVQNVKQLVYDTVNLGDSKAMKRLSFLTMIFLPGSFMAGIFGMNVIEINPGTYGTMVQYVAATLTLTILTIWIIMAFQNQLTLRDDEGMWKSLLWPISLVQLFISRSREDHRS